MYFQQGGLTLLKLYVSVPRKVNPGHPGWPRFDLAWLFRRAYSDLFSAILDYILRGCQSLRDSFFYLEKLHWYLYLLLSYYYDPDMFIFCWSSNFVEKVVLNESMAAKMASRVSSRDYKGDREGIPHIHPIP